MVSTDASDGADTHANERDAAEMWRQNIECPHDIELPDRKEPEYYTVPNDAVEPEPETRESLESFLEHNEHFRFMRSHGFGPETASDPSGYNGYESWGDDVTMFLDTIMRRDAPDDAVFQFALLVNFEPIVFEYTRWLDGRGGPKKTGKATHLSFSATDNIELIDIVIPKEQLGEGRDRIGVYTINTIMRIYSSSESKYRTSNERRFVLYYGATGWPDVPCRERYPSSEWSSLEERLFRDPAYHDPIYIFPAEKSDMYSLDDTIVAKPGEELVINLSRHHVGGDGMPGGALVPFFGIEKAGEMWMYANSTSFEEADGRIAYRRQFTVEAPRESGVHSLYVAQWSDAYKPARDYWGRRPEGTGVIETAPGHISNIIPVRVK